MEPGSSPDGVNCPSNQFQQFFNPHMNADVSPGTKGKYFKRHRTALLDAHRLTIKKFIFYLQRSSKMLLWTL